MTRDDRDAVRRSAVAAGVDWLMRSSAGELLDVPRRALRRWRDRGSARRSTGSTAIAAPAIARRRRRRRARHRDLAVGSATAIDDDRHGVGRRRVGAPSASGSRSSSGAGWAAAPTRCSRCRSPRRACWSTRWRRAGATRRRIDASARDRVGDRWRRCARSSRCATHGLATLSRLRQVDALAAPARATLAAATERSRRRRDGARPRSRRTRRPLERDLVVDRSRRGRATAATLPGRAGSAAEALEAQVRRAGGALRDEDRGAPRLAMPDVGCSAPCRLGR